MQLNKYPLWIGILILSFPVFFNERFTSGLIAMMVYVLFIFIGFTWITFYVGQKFRIRIAYIFVFILFLELIIFSSFWLVKTNTIDSSYIKQKYHGFYTGYFRSIPCFQYDLGRYDKDLFYTLQPGRFRNRNIEFNNIYDVNEMGLRDDSESLNFPRIMVWGDSHAMGFGVEQDETFANVLEKKLNYKVLNTGIISYGTAREFEMFKRLNSDSTDLIIIQYCPNDAIENDAYVNNDNKLIISSEQRYHFAQNRNFLQSHYYPFKYIFEAIAHQLRKRVAHIGKQTPSKRISQENQISNFFKILELLQSRFNGHIIVFNISTKDTTSELIYGFSQYVKHNQLERIQCEDFSTILKDDDFHIIDEHLNASGHRKIGEHIYNLIHADTSFFSFE